MSTNSPARALSTGARKSNLPSYRQRQRQPPNRKEPSDVAKLALFEVDVISRITSVLHRENYADASLGDLNHEESKSSAANRRVACSSLDPVHEGSLTWTARLYSVFDQVTKQWKHDGA